MSNRDLCRCEVGSVIAVCTLKEGEVQVLYFTVMSVFKRFIEFIIKCFAHKLPFCWYREQRIVFISHKPRDNSVSCRVNTFQNYLTQVFYILKSPLSLFTEHEASSILLK